MGFERGGSRRPRRAPVAWIFWAALLFLAGQPALGAPPAAAQVAPAHLPLDLRPVEVHEPAGARRGEAAKVLYLPAGFSATVFARLAVSQARALAVDAGGTVFVSVPRYGAVEAFADRNGDGFADAQATVLADLRCPYGLDVMDDWLYVAQSRRITRFPLAAGLPAQVSGAGEVVVDDLPESPCAPHGYRPLALSRAEDALFVALGSSCNACVEDGPGRAQSARVWRYPLTLPGPGAEVARGLRNVTGLAINPWSGALWGVDAERDDMGDDVPPEQITELGRGADYGWPFCYRGLDERWHRDPRVPSRDDECAGLTVPTVSYQAHSTPLGLAFHDGRGLPAEFGPSLFVALHGSWDHSTGVGYKVIRIPLDERGQPHGDPQEFALGWLPAPTSRAPDLAWGRPVGVAVGADGALYVSDDSGGVVYRMVYAGFDRAL